MPIDNVAIPPIEPLKKVLIRVRVEKGGLTVRGSVLLYVTKPNANFR